MAELLSHVLRAFALFTVFKWWIGWFDDRWMAVGMVGAVLPNLSRLELLLGAELVRGLPWGTLQLERATYFRWHRGSFGDCCL